MHRSTYKPSLLAMAVVSAVGFSHQASAQLEEVIVTAQKKEETLVEAPVAVSVVSGQDINDLWREEKLTDIPRIGKTLAAKIDELLRTGQLEFYDRLANEVPLGVVEMLEIPDVGPKTAARLWQELGLTDIEGVERAARAGTIRTLPRMSEKTETKILAGIDFLRRRSGRSPLGVVWPLAQAMLEELLEDPEYIAQIKRLAPLGRVGEPEEMAGPAVFLASDASSMVTGHILNVDAGTMAI